MARPKDQPPMADVIDFGKRHAVPFPVPMLEPEEQFDQEMRAILAEIERKIEDQQKERG
jgi:hypothetical protein